MYISVTVGLRGQCTLNPEQAPLQHIEHSAPTSGSKAQIQTEIKIADNLKTLDRKEADRLILKNFPKTEKKNRTDN